MTGECAIAKEIGCTSDGRFRDDVEKREDSVHFFRASHHNSATEDSRVLCAATYSSSQPRECSNNDERTITLPAAVTEFFLCVPYRQTPATIRIVRTNYRSASPSLLLLCFFYPMRMTLSSMNLYGGTSKLSGAGPKRMRPLTS